MNKIFKLICTSFLMLLIINTNAQIVGINVDGSAPNVNAMLDVKSSGTIGRGLLIPRLVLAQRTVNSTSGGLLNASGQLHGGAAQGLMVYQTDGVEGFYYNTSTSSIPVWQYLTTSSGVSSTSWLLTGNSGTSASLNFIGTVDNTSLVFKANNQRSGQIDLTTNNTSFGYQSANALPTGTNNSFIGYQAGYVNTTGNSNTGIGSTALVANTTGGNNSATGMGALASNTTGSNNTAHGTGALRNNTTALGNTAFGAAALYNTTTASSNSAFGAYALQNNITGTGNTSMGYSALGGNTTGNGNSAFGSAALQANTTGINNTAIGNGCLQFVSIGNSNACVGSFIMTSATSASNNVAMGYGVMGGLTTGSYNTAIGNTSGTTITTGSNNTFIGNGADANSAALTNATAIGYNAKVNTSNAIVLGSLGTFVGIGTPSPGNFLEVNSGTGGTSGLRLKMMPQGAVLFMNSSGDVAQSNNNFYFDAINYRLSVGAGQSPNSTLQLAGSISVGITTKTANYTASVSDYTILCNNTSGAITIALPAAAGCKGRIYVIKKISASGTNSVSIDPSVSELIDGAISFTMNNQYDATMIQSDGTAWYIIGH